ncbi:MAG: ABC transporter permease [Gemmataceae bacterium]
MRSIFTLAFKDIRIQTRDYFGLFWIAIFPLLYAMFFGAVFSGVGGSPEGRSLQIVVVDEERSPGSEAFVDRLRKSNALNVTTSGLEDARQAVLKGKAVAYLVIKGGFGAGGLDFGGKGKQIEMGIDPARKADAGVLKGMIMEAVFADMQQLFSDPAKGQEMLEKALKQIQAAKDLDPAAVVLLELGLKQLTKAMAFFTEARDFGPAKDAKGFNLVDLKEEAVTFGGATERPRNSFEITFPQSILWGMMGCVASFSISIVVERNQGTFLRLRTSPLTWRQVLAGKGMACFLTSAFVIVALLTFAALILGVRLGNLPLLALAIVSVALCFTGLMLFFSTLGKTEAGVAGSGWGIMMPMAMLGGGMVPLIFMPGWMQTASNFSPVKWGIYALEGAVWRGFGLAEMLLPAAILIGVGAVAYGLGVWKLSRE